mmetsp:Transcript_14973/g.25582  ORF Transcript_14973/g.25582 Transcript_14973/m.25582 type:complete len:201 (-) Transcript_14973:1291-1893(-)
MSSYADIITVRSSQKRQKNLSLITTIFATTAFILMWLGNIRCHFIQFKAVSGIYEPFSLEFGIWYYIYLSIYERTDGEGLISESCRGYPNHFSLDDSWKAARAFSILAEFFGTMLILFNVVTACHSKWSSTSQKYRFGRAALVICGYAITGIFQGLCLLFLNSNACKNNILVKNSVISNLSSRMLHFMKLVTFLLEPSVA